ncbi:MAG: hypothetical protein IJZ29_00150 [Clostridia bacterium]|nr:hypothetical protein [Clostridia bacterium]
MEEISKQTSKTISPPKKLLTQMKCDRLGKIFSNIAFTCAVLIILVSLSTILIPLMYTLLIICVLLLCILLVIFTLGMILLIPDSILSKLWNFMLDVTSGSTNDLITNISQTCFSLIPYFSIAGIILCILSLIMLIVSNGKNHIVRIIFISLSIILMIVALVIYYALGGTIWQN